MYSDFFEPPKRAEAPAKGNVKKTTKKGKSARFAEEMEEEEDEDELVDETRETMGRVKSDLFEDSEDEEESEQSESAKGLVEPADPQPSPPTSEGNESSRRRLPSLSRRPSAPRTGRCWVRRAAGHDQKTRCSRSTSTLSRWQRSCLLSLRTLLPRWRSSSRSVSWMWVSCLTVKVPAADAVAEQL